MKIMIAIAAFSAMACTASQPKPSADVVIQADKDFSAMSAEQGMQKAFLAYMDSNAVMLRPNSMPLVGKAVETDLKSSADTGFSLIWQPLAGDIAQSGDLGYTYGTFTFKLKSGDTTAKRGTYCSIWKKQADGKWKFVMDTGNDGLGR